MNTNQLLTRSECTALRGIAILAIVLHNYCHWLRGMVHENEYNYNQDNVDALIRIIAHPDANIFMQLMSFFGHYGVPIFLFLSAYGLVMKYEHGPNPMQGKVYALQTNRLMRLKHLAEEVWRFVRYHYLKLFRMMILGFVCFLLVDNITPGAHHYRAIDIVAQLFMVNNFMPEPHHVIWPGPYWFFGLMLQLYIIYRVAFYKRHWGWVLGFIAVCTVAQYLCGPGSDALNYLRYNFVGGILPFGIGLLYARLNQQFEGFWYNLLFFVLSLMLILHYSDGFVAWLFVPMFVCSAGFTLVKILPRWLLNSLEWIGQISAALFVMHPILRKIFIPISRRGDLWTGLIIYLLASICVAYLFNLLLKRLPQPKY